MKRAATAFLIVLVSVQTWAAVAPDSVKEPVKKEAVHRHVDIDVDQVDERILSAQSWAEQSGIHCREWVDARIAVWMHWSNGVNRQIGQATGAVTKEKNTSFWQGCKDAWRDVHSLFSKN